MYYNVRQFNIILLKVIPITIVLVPLCVFIGMIFITRSTGMINGIIFALIFTPAIIVALILSRQYSDSFKLPGLKYDPVITRILNQYYAFDIKKADIVVEKQTITLYMRNFRHTFDNDIGIRDIIILIRNHKLYFYSDINRNDFTCDEYLNRIAGPLIKAVKMEITLKNY